MLLVVVETQALSGSFAEVEAKPSLSVAQVAVSVLRPEWLFVDPSLVVRFAQGYVVVIV